MGKIIIDVKDNIDPLLAMDMVHLVISRGKVSEARGYKQYCFVTVFKPVGTARMRVVTRGKRREEGPDSFIVEKDY